MSTLIKSAQYDATTKTLAVDLQTGDRYRYSDVPDSIARRFTRAESPGRFFNQEIRSKFPTTKIR